MRVRGRYRLTWTQSKVFDCTYGRALGDESEIRPLGIDHGQAGKLGRDPLELVSSRSPTSGRPREGFWLSEVLPPIITSGNEAIEFVVGISGGNGSNLFPNIMIPSSWTAPKSTKWRRDIMEIFEVLPSKEEMDLMVDFYFLEVQVLRA